jgi:hypothetical protein
MGLTVTSFPIINGIATVDNVYINIRDIRTTKQTVNNTTPYELEFFYIVKKEENNISTQIITKNSAEAFIGNLWDLAYEYLKEELTSKNLHFTDTL